jgi:AraC family transcriptional regulator
MTNLSTVGGRIAPDLSIKRTAPGRLRHEAAPDLVLSVHAGAPVRVSCTDCRTVRTRGEINVLPAGITDEWVEDDPSEHVELRLPARLLETAARDMGLDPSRVDVAPQYHFHDPRIEHIAWALEAEHRAENPSGLVYRESLGLALAIHLLARYRRTCARSPGLDPDRLARVVDYAEAHLAADLSLPVLARVAAVSASHFRVLFKRSVGVPVHEYVIQRRVERARELLARGALPASQIAVDAGFAHQSHMAKSMRKVLGVTPRAIARGS